MEAFELAGHGVRDKHYEPDVDTIFILSDGLPNEVPPGTDPIFGTAEWILRQVSEWNRFRKLAINTIVIGKGDWKNSQFMSSLATQNDGQFTNLGD